MGVTGLKGCQQRILFGMCKNKEVGGVNTIQGSIRGERYHNMDINYPNYVMLMMKTYGTLEHLEGSDTHRRYKGEGGGLVTKQFSFISNKYINLTTATIISIILFKLRVHELQSIGPTGFMPTY